MNIEQATTEQTNIVYALKRMRALLSDESKWNKRSNARTHAYGKGDPVDPLNSKANCWCLYGSAHKILNARDEQDISFTKIVTILRLHSERLYNEAPSTWQDNATHSEMLEFLDLVIDAEAQKQ